MRAIDQEDAPDRGMFTLPRPPFCSPFARFIHAAVTANNSQDCSPASKTHARICYQHPNLRFHRNATYR